MAPLTPTLSPLRAARGPEPIGRCLAPEAGGRHPLPREEGRGEGPASRGLAPMLLVMVASLGTQASAESAGDPLAELLGGQEPPRLLASRPIEGTRLQLAALLFHGESGGQLPLAVLAAPWRAAAEGEAAPAVEVAVLVETDLASLLGPHRDPRLQLEAYLYALAPDGTLRAHLGRRLELHGHRLAAEVGSGLKLAGRLHLPPGTYSLRVLVREERSGAAGLEVMPLVVPGPREGVVLASPLLLAEPDRAWSWVAGQAAGEPPPFEVGGRPIFPSARPVLRPGEEVRGVVRLAAGKLPEAGAAFRLLDARGGRALEIPAALARLSQGEDLFEVSLTLPELPAGRYRLAGPGEDSELSVVVAAPGRAGEEGALTWLQVRPPPAVVAPGAGRAAREGDRRARAGPRREARRQYRRALELLAAGSPEAARTTLSAFEKQVVREAPYAAAEALGQAQQHLAGELIGREPRCLAPLFLLHFDLWREDLLRGDLYLASHQQGMVRTLIDLGLRHAAPGGRAAGTARAALLSLAAVLQEQGLHESARQAFERVLAAGGNDPATLLSLAFLAEGSARYGEAVAALARLVAAHPGHREGRLRLAINQRRTGDAAAAEARLRALAAQETADWVGPVAASELAQMLAQAGRLEEAVGVLEGFRARGADHRWLAVQLAHLLDRAGEPRRARQVLAELDSGAGPLGPSPRFLYRTPPREARESPRAILEAEAAAGLPDLAKALEEVRGGGP